MQETARNIVLVFEHFQKFPTLQEDQAELVSFVEMENHKESHARISAGVKEVLERYGSFV